jgi:hypothetical protein
MQRGASCFSGHTRNSQRKGRCAAKRGFAPEGVKGEWRKRHQGPGCPKNLTIFGSYPARPLTLDPFSPGSDDKD